MALLLLNHPSIWNFTCEHCNWWFWTSNSPTASPQVLGFKAGTTTLWGGGGSKDWTQGFAYARWAFYHLWVTAQPNSSILKNPEEPRNRNRRKKESFQNSCKEMVKIKILAFVSRRLSQWAHGVCTCWSCMGGKRPMPQSNFLWFEMAPISQELAKDENKFAWVQTWEYKKV